MSSRLIHQRRFSISNNIISSGFFQIFFHRWKFTFVFSDGMQHYKTRPGKSRTGKLMIPDMMLILSGGSEGNGRGAADRINVQQGDRNILDLQGVEDADLTALGDKLQRQGHILPVTRDAETD